MLSVIHSRKGKRSHHFKQTRRPDKDKSIRSAKSEAKDCHRKSAKYDVIVEDFVLNYKLPEDTTANSPKTNAMQKRKLPNEDDYDDWDWAPYPRRIKSQRHDASLYESNGYLSDEFETSHIVPDWEEVMADQGSVCLSSCEGDQDDSLNSKTADIHVVTIDEVIEFETLKSPGCHNFNEDICFDIEKLYGITGAEGIINGINGKDSLVNKQMLVKITNSSRLAHYEDEQKTLKEVQQITPYSVPFDCTDSCEDEEYFDQLQNDCQIEKFNLARCFKCRRKVHSMQDCPRHLTNGTMGIIKRVT